MAGVDHGNSLNREDIDWESIKWDELSPEEKWNYEHLRMNVNQKHHTHQIEVIVILLLVVVVCLIGLILWRKKRPYSYHVCTMLGVLIIPAGLSIWNNWWRFSVVWLGFHAITILLTIQSLDKPIQNRKHRLVYRWLLLIYRISYIVVVFGFLTVIATFLGFNLIFNVKPSIWMDLGLLCMFYALYFGVMSRDLAEICMQKLVTDNTILDLETDICAFCLNKLVVTADEEAVLENTAFRLSYLVTDNLMLPVDDGGWAWQMVLNCPQSHKFVMHCFLPLLHSPPLLSFQLTCGHKLHEVCIKGWWCIVRKRHACPYCHEVNHKRMFLTRWEKVTMKYGQLLDLGDWVRLLLCWQPVTLLLVQGINWTIGLE